MVAHVPRLFVPGLRGPGPLTLDGEQAKRLGAVMRLRAGDTFLAFGGDGREWEARITALDRGRIGRPVYNASKAGMDTYLEALRNRLWRRGVRVTTIRPGFVLTPMTEGLQLKGAIPADKAAELILRARDDEKAIAYVPGKWRLIMFVIRNIPSFVFRRLSI